MTREKHRGADALDQALSVVPVPCASREDPRLARVEPGGHNLELLAGLTPGEALELEAA